MHVSCSQSPSIGDAFFPHVEGLRDRARHSRSCDGLRKVVVHARIDTEEQVLDDQQRAVIRDIRACLLAPCARTRVVECVEVATRELAHEAIRTSHVVERARRDPGTHPVGDVRVQRWKSPSAFVADRAIDRSSPTIFSALTIGASRIRADQDSVVSARARPGRVVSAQCRAQLSSWLREVIGWRLGVLHKFDVIPRLVLNSTRRVVRPFGSKSNVILRERFNTSTQLTTATAV
jgi:hypothetical protein